MKGRKHLLHFSDDTTPDTPSESTLDLSLMSNDRHLVLGQREKEEEIQEEEEVNSLFLSISDVESAISLIISRISPSSQVSYPRIIFKHQLYPIIPNYTEIESEINILRQNKKIRLLILPTGSIGIILNSEYISNIQQSINQLESSNLLNVAESLKRFLAWLEFSTQSSMLEEDLLLSTCSNPLSKSDIQNIVDQGYLFPHRSSKATGIYYLSHHQIGHLTRAVNTMTDYILKTIRRTQYKEISEEKICQTIFQTKEFDDNTEQRYSKKAKKIPRGLTSSAPSGLGWKYHLYDMLGRDLITRVESGGLKGPILRIKKN